MRLTFIQACTRSPRARARASVAASGSKDAAGRPAPRARGSTRLAKYASPRPRTCTSSVLNPLAAAERTIAATLSGLTRLLRVTHSARTSPASDAARGSGPASTTSRHAMSARSSEARRGVCVIITGWVRTQGSAGMYSAAPGLSTHRRAQRQADRQASRRIPVLRRRSFWQHNDECDGISAMTRCTCWASTPAARRRCVCWPTARAASCRRRADPARTSRRRASWRSRRCCTR